MVGFEKVCCYVADYQIGINETILLENINSFTNQTGTAIRVT